MLATGLYKRIAILPGGTNMTAKVERGGLDVIYRRIQWFVFAQTSNSDVEREKKQKQSSDKTVSVI